MAKADKSYAREIVVGVVSALGTALVLWLVGAFNRQLSEIDHQSLSSKLERSDSFKRILIDVLKKEPSLKGPPGEKGTTIVGPEGPAGKDNYGPIGGVLAYAGPHDSLAKDWRVCDGSELKREDYPELFRVIGTRYGGTGNETFKLPNYQGYFLRGVDPGAKST